MGENTVISHGEDFVAWRLLNDTPASGNATYNHTTPVKGQTDHSSGHSTWEIEFLINGVIIPGIAIFGIIGNILNLLILSWRYNKREADVLEKGALLCLIALAISDMLFCVVILPHMFYYKHKTVFINRSFRMYYTTYGLYFQNVFIKTSTYLTLVVGLARYVGICHPLRARMFIGLNGVRATCLLTFVLWFALMSPMLWSYEIHAYENANSTSYILDTGEFARNRNMNVIFTYAWAFLGYFIPIGVLAFCNVNLICALRQSMRLREATARSSNSANQEVSARITLTLIILIIMFMLLVSPSELLHFVQEVIKRENYRQFEVAMMVGNVLQALNFAFHFVLYCVVNVTFRNIVMNIACRILRVLRPSKASHVTSGRYVHSLTPMGGAKENLTICTSIRNDSFKSCSFKNSFKGSCRSSSSRPGDEDTYL